MGIFSAICLTILVSGAMLGIYIEYQWTGRK